MHTLASVLLIALLFALAAACDETRGLCPDRLPGPRPTASASARDAQAPGDR
jgi:hypothetical protein